MKLAAAEEEAHQTQRLQSLGQLAGEPGRLQKPFTSEQLLDAVREALE